MLKLHSHGFKSHWHQTFSDELGQLIISVHLDLWGLTVADKVSPLGVNYIWDFSRPGGTAIKGGHCHILNLAYI